VFHGIQTTILEQWPEDETSRYTAVSGFLFLRTPANNFLFCFISFFFFFCFNFNPRHTLFYITGFFNPAILGPKLFGLLDSTPPPHP
jgi:hypothetical protein